MKNKLIFVGVTPPESTQREIFASFLTVSGLYPDKDHHIVMDASLGYYRAKFITNHEWEVTPLKYAYVPSAPFKNW